MDDPECRAALSMVTSHQQPDPRVGHPGRESNPVQPRSQWSAAIQTQGATGERSPEIRMPLVICNQSVECNRAKGPSCPFCASGQTSEDTGGWVAQFAGNVASRTGWKSEMAISDPPMDQQCRLFGADI